MPKILLLSPDAPGRARWSALIGEADPSAGVHNAGDAADAARMLAGGRFDCIFADCPITGPDSHTLLSAAMAEGVPVVAVACGSDGDCAGAMDAGADDALMGSHLRADDLRQCLRRAVRLMDARRNSSDMGARLRACQQRLRSLESADGARDGIEEALRQSEYRLRLALDAAGMGTWERDLTTEQISRSARDRELMGNPPDTLEGFISGVHEDDRARVAAYDKRIRLNMAAEAEGVEFRVVRPDGTVRWVEGRGMAYRDAAGKPLRIIGVSMDITARKQAEEALRLSEEQHRASFELAAVGQAHTDPLTGRFLCVNRRFCEMVGYSADELLQMTFLDLTAPEDMAITREILDRAFVDPSPQYEIDKRYIRKDGRTIRVSINATFIRDPSGRPTRRLAVVQDVTERSRAEGALRESEERFRRLVDQAADAIFVSGVDGRFTDVNLAACQGLGYTREELLSLNVWDVALNMPPERVAELCQKMTSGAVVTIDGVHRRRDGSTFPVEVRLVAIEIGGEMMVIGVARDVTERTNAARRTARLLEQVIGAQEEERRRVARELHDETGQSLTSLLVGLRTLQDVPTLEAARSWARGLRALAARAMEDVHRLAGGLRPSALDDLGLPAALERYAADYAQTHGLTVRLEAGGTELGRLPPAAETAVYRIAQEALTNIARHAEARTARITFDRAPGLVRMLVEDDGRGFDVEPVLSAADVGGRIGLHSMRERAALLGGTLTVESVPGDGTTLTLEIPVDDAPAGQQEL
ncbi:MAG: putative Response regulator/sensory box histidine kinase [Phycisphaerales bacterium]|nr:putative Response regulator/sensory box histidine kinase [Phycisphaerales bacterium]